MLLLSHLNTHLKEGQMNMVYLKISQPVHPESIFCCRVGQNHVWIVEHVQAVQRQRIDFQLIQRELGICVKAHVTCQKVGQLFV